jgi:hypothetical protein
VHPPAELEARWRLDGLLEPEDDHLMPPWTKHYSQKLEEDGITVSTSKLMTAPEIQPIRLGRSLNS